MPELAREKPLKESLKNGRSGCWGGAHWPVCYRALAAGAIRRNAIRGARARRRTGRYLAADNGLKNHHLQGLTGFKANYAGAQARA
jgi:hypothetical protein